ncbi:MAG: hypothetical protein NC098_08505 [Lachnoclostridium sp.]|nr:hypothetical protein [Lachnoclostridium sp.]
MKKIFTLMAAVLAAFTVSAETVTITWALSDKSQLGATIEGDGAEFVTASDMTLGSNLSVKGNRTTNNVKGLEISPSSAFPSTAGSNTNNYIKFPFTVQDGKQLKVTNISFYVGKVGTDNTIGANVLFINGDGTKLTVQTGVGFNRNKAENDWYTYKNYDAAAIDAMDWNPLSSSNTLVFNVYDGKKGTKSCWASTIVITGEVEDAGFVDARDEVELSWDPATVTLKLREAFNAPVLNNPSNVAVEYTATGSSATVDENGVISLVEGVLGETTITASFAGDDNYKPAVASTVINVLTNKTDVNVGVDMVKAPFHVDGLFSVTADTEVAAEAELFNDEKLSLTTVYESKLTDYGKTYAGYTFAKAMQLRTKAAPSVDNVTGTDNGGSTPIVVKPTTDMTIAVFGRRQVEENANLKDEVDDVENNEITVNHYYDYTKDGKSIFAVDQEAPTTKLAKNVYHGEWGSDKYDYAWTVTTFTLEAGHTYTLYATGTTYQLNGVGYILPENLVPAAPAHDQTTDAINLEGKTVTITLSHENEKAHIYYAFIPAVNESGAENAPLKAGVMHNDVEHALYTEAITLDTPGTLSYFSYLNGQKSEVKTLAVSDSETTGIEAVTVEAEGAVEYFNLQGIRVENPANGVFIRRQGNNVSKVLVK